jgi:hypothetical protein
MSVSFSSFEFVFVNKPARVMTESKTAGCGAAAPAVEEIEVNRSIRC